MKLVLYLTLCGFYGIVTGLAFPTRRLVIKLVMALVFGFTISQLLHIALYGLS